MKRFIVLLCICSFLFFGCDEIDAQIELAETETTEIKQEVTETERICKVTFDSLGGTSVESQEVAWGNKAKEPTIPTKKCNCEFDGWYLGDEKWSFIGYVVTEDITLTAKWIDCFGLNDKEIEDIKELISHYYDDDYTWRDIENLQKEDPYIDYKGTVWEDLCEYNITFKNGKKSSYRLKKQ